ncbi:heat shock protein transcriptional repressor HspR [Nocardia sp. CNY236]|uniref:heat shock protein transcriptional repressor HspR n=1 Tax=Nocardia sp. CNY236 TaxID=1169152 RepID=UPI000490D4A4|nr:helix-turn-helix transcriptional regulator [Nocardia sp. CNY236]
MSAEPKNPSAGARAEFFMISVAAELAGMHAQTLRTYDRLGLVTPQRTSGGGRRYSARDVELLREVQRLSQDEGVNLAGIKRVIELTNQVEELRQQVAELSAEAERMRAAYRAELAPTQRSTALVVWQPRNRRDHGHRRR